MSNVSGTINVDVQFTDSTTSSGVQSLKTLTLRQTQEHTGGKVAIVTGTCGTAGVQVLPSSITSYRNAAGNTVSMTVTRIAFAADPVGVCEDPSLPDNSTFRAVSRNGQPAVFSPFVAGPAGVRIRTTSATASFTLVLYGT